MAMHNEGMMRSLPRKDVVIFRAGGEHLRVYFQPAGSQWVSPSNGRQHPDIEDAARAEIERLILAAGDEPGDCAELIALGVRDAVEACERDATAVDEWDYADAADDLP